MPLIYSRSQIKKHLFDLGWGEVDEVTLSRFMKDLKKLVRYEEKLRHEKKKNKDENTSLSQISSHSRNDAPDDVDNQENISGRMKDMSLKGESSKDKNEEIVENSANSSKNRPAQTSNVSKVGKNLEEKSQTLKNSYVVHKKPFQTTNLIDTQSSGSKTSLNSCSNSSSSSGGSSSVRCILPKRPDRVDPVSLYHYYKSIWDKYKPPGEDSRAQLRWNVRAGTLGQVPCHPCGGVVKYLR